MEKQKVSVYDVIQAQLLQKIEHAIKTGEKFYWVKPWEGGAPYPCSYDRPEKPFNAFVNIIFLEPGEYLTFSRIKELHECNPDVKIRKGAKQRNVYQSFPVFEKDKNGREILDDNNNKIIKGFQFRYVKEYHIDDIEGLESHFSHEEYAHTLTQEMDFADKLIDSYCNENNIEMVVKKGTDKAFFREIKTNGESSYSIHIPDKTQFPNIYEYYSTVFHEMAHSTRSIINREKLSYAQEELVAEVAAATMCFQLHINDENTQQNSIAYLMSWSKKIREEKSTAIVAACNEAKKACDTILMSQQYVQIQEKAQTDIQKLAPEGRNSTRKKVSKSR